MLTNPKYAANVAKTVRLASCYGVSQVWWTGERVSLDLQNKKKLPREERMKGYGNVSMIQHDYVFDQFKGAVPVAIEVRNTSQYLQDFEHPENALYVFGPEDGSIPSTYLSFCHKFVIIPTRHCLNLATAVATVLWDRQVKMFQSGKEHIVTPGEFEQRGLIEPDWKQTLSDRRGSLDKEV